MRNVLFAFVVVLSCGVVSEACDSCKSEKVCCCEVKCCVDACCRPTLADRIAERRAERACERAERVACRAERVAARNCCKPSCCAADPCVVTSPTVITKDSSCGN